MKNQLNEVELDRLVGQALAEAADWPLTDDDLDAMFDAGPEQVDSQTLSRARAIADRLRKRWAKRSPVKVLLAMNTLFGVDDAPSLRTGVSYEDSIFEAFQAVSDGWSIDYVIADPNRNASFVHECWKRNVQATPYNLNWALLNARKTGRLGSVAVHRYTLPSAKYNVLVFACEFALRHMQDEHYRERNADLSLDEILCDPKSGSVFEGYCRQIAPGFESVEYRWSALRIRKSLRRDRHSTAPLSSDFRFMGRSVDLKIREVPDSPGLLWLRSGEDDVYFGAASSLRDQVEGMLQVPEARSLVVPRWIVGDRYKEMSFAIMECSQSANDREGHKASLVSHKSPMHNVVPWGAVLASA